VLDDSRAPFYRWFAGGRLNTCHNALDRHVDGGRADQLALVYDSPVTDTTAAFTYRELRDAVDVERGWRRVVITRSCGVADGALCPIITSRWSVQPSRQWSTTTMSRRTFGS
jgi:hypothetical protein